MDALNRLAPIARPLLRQVDTALATLGAPAEHPIWELLRRLGTTPADALTFVAELEPVRLRAAADQLRTEADGYTQAGVPTALSAWAGSAAEGYAARAAAMAEHLHSALADRLRSTASYVDAVAGWHQDSRDRFARCLADVLGSSQAITVRSQPALNSGLGAMLREGDQRGFSGVVLAAAEIGVAVLTAADEALAAGRDLSHRWGSELAEVPYRAPAYLDPTRDATIRLQH